ncbi:MAG: hypothetical protein AMJ59_06130 [Gammaproteobacteria bacterium SG8_31]|jgi:hypothetical protein|nr:MAG: hypothetical protein AMJ59_06130 [Gammaproteobacteria bacterium SG8_31]
MCKKDQTATAVLDQEIVDEILGTESGAQTEKGRLVRLDRDTEEDGPHRDGGAEEEADKED